MTQEFDFAILIYAADDVLRRRGVQHFAPRDNVIFESGLFIGTIGSERTFLVACKDDKLLLPNDLSGVSMAYFHKNRSDSNLRAAVTPAAVKIREEIRRLGPRSTKAVPCAASGVEAAFRHQADAIRSFSRGIAGVELAYRRPRQLRTWATNVVGMLYDSFKQREKDVYAVWLRPTKERNKLEVFIHRNLKRHRHYRFTLGEGLAGMVWKEGCAASTSHMRQHKWWVYREGCENMSYVCACVGEPGRDGGILAIGSDAGFQVQEGDQERVEGFASLLELASRGLILSNARKRL